MHFPNRSIATAGIGIACALVLLVVLSWPALFGATTASNLPAPTYASNSATIVYETSLSTSKITSAVSSVTVAGTTVASVFTTPSSTVGNSSNGIIPGAGDTMTSITSEAATSTVASSTVMSGANVQSSPLAQPLFAFNYGSVSGTASGSTNLSAFLMLAIISIVSLVIAASSMLFMKRRVNSEKSW